MNSSPHPTLLRRLAALVLIFVAGMLASCESGGNMSHVSSAAAMRPNSVDGLLSSHNKTASSSASAIAAPNELGNRALSARSPEAPVESRPGLATTAGGYVSSSVASTSFFRRSKATPDAMDAFHYNDEVGARAMLGVLGKPSVHHGLFAVAGGRLKMGLSGSYWGSTFDWLEAGGNRVVMGKQGAAYGIRVKNVSNARLEIVLSVDGLGVRDGKAASVTRRGYVLDPGEEDTIRGFRTNDQSVRRFVFGTVANSEAAKKGQARNVGVIGVAVYEEDEVAAKSARLEEALRRAGAKPFQ